MLVKYIEHGITRKEDQNGSFVDCDTRLMIGGLTYVVVRTEYKEASRDIKNRFIPAHAFIHIERVAHE